MSSSIINNNNKEDFYSAYPRVALGALQLTKKEQHKTENKNYNQKKNY